MLIGGRIREIREFKHLSQGDIEKRTGLLRPYISRVEHGHTVPGLETLEKFAHGLEVPLYRLFFQGNQKPTAHKWAKPPPPERLWGSSGREALELAKLCLWLSRMSERDRTLLFQVARRMASR